MKKIYVLASALLTMNAFSQIATPTIQTLPMNENFGATTFTAMPSGFSTGMVSGAPVSTQAAAQTSSVTAAAPMTAATATTATGGSFGYAKASNGMLYVQHSASTTTGTNQLTLTLNTLYWTNILVNYSVEMLNAAPRTIGLILQYRVGLTGSWTTISGSTYSHSSADRTTGQVDTYVNLTLPTAAENKPVVQLRWATWRGTQTGNSSGVGIDNVNISATPQGLTANVSASAASGCSQIFLSSYVQDTLTNDAIELYNPTASSISLSGYYLTVATGTNAASYYPLSGTIAPYKTFLAVNAKAPSAWLRSKANQLINEFTFSYDAVIALVYSSNPLVSAVMIDAVGTANGAPTANGWVVGSLGDTAYTKNHTLNRLRTVTEGDLKWSEAQFTWFPHPMDSYGYLGRYTNVCDVDDTLPVASFTINGVVQDMCPFRTGNSDDVTVRIAVQLVGQGTPWLTNIKVSIPDQTTGETEVNCTPYGVQGTRCSTACDYSFTTDDGYGNGQVGFPADTVGVATYIRYLNVVVSETQTSGQNQIYACMGIQPDRFGTYDTLSANTSSASNYEILVIRGCAYMGIKNISDNKQIQAYPNPFDNQITIENYSQMPITKVSIIDMLGREVLTTTPEQIGTVTINTQSLDNAMYFIKVYNNNDNFTVKMLKE